MTSKSVIHQQHLSKAILPDVCRSCVPLAEYM